mgnify:CR=1 FL=1
MRDKNLTQLMLGLAVLTSAFGCGDGAPAEREKKPAGVETTSTGGVIHRDDQGDK